MIGAVAGNSRDHEGYRPVPSKLADEEFPACVPNIKNLPTPPSIIDMIFIFYQHQPSTRQKTMATTTFPHFQNLPREMCDQIWNDTLPKNDKPKRQAYSRSLEKGVLPCWCPSCLQKSNPDWEPNEDLNLQLDFHHNLLDHVQVEIPLFSVNWEACGIALAWMHK